MKKLPAMIALAFALVVPLAGAQQTSPAQPGADAALPAEPDTAAMEQGLGRLQAQLDELKKAKDPAQQRELMRQYRQQMADMMAKMGAHGRGQMMGSMSMRGRMQDMQQRMQKMMATESMDKQSELMAEQHRRMHEMMAMMPGMHRGGRMMATDDDSIEHPMGMMSSQGANREWMLAAFRQMEKRLDLMQEMLEHE